jgi:peroxiredoxin
VETGLSVKDSTLFTTEGQAVLLSSYWSNSPVLLVFYPKDNTRVCTAQLCDYRDRLTDFTALGVQLLGINPGTAQQHRQFTNAHHLSFPILSDPTHACCRAYGAAAWWGTRRLVVALAQNGQERWRLIVNPFARPSVDTLINEIKAHA